MSQNTGFYYDLYQIRLYTVNDRYSKKLFQNVIIQGKFDDSSNWENIMIFDYTKVDVYDGWNTYGLKDFIYTDNSCLSNNSCYKRYQYIKFVGGTYNCQLGEIQFIGNVVYNNNNSSVACDIEISVNNSDYVKNNSYQFT